MNVPITAGVAVNLLSVAGITVGTKVEIVACSQQTVKVFNTAGSPTVGVDDFIPCIYGQQKVEGNTTDLGLWGYSSNGGLIDIREV